MSPNDNGPDSQAEVIAAAHAAASWVRARRAAWSDVPLDIGVFEPPPAPLETGVFEPTPAPLETGVFEPPPAPPLPPVPEPATFVPPAPLVAPAAIRQPPAAAPPIEKPVVARAAEEERAPAAPRAPLSPWVARGAIAAAAVAAVVVGGPYVWRALPSMSSLPSLPSATAPAAVPAAPPGTASATTGSLHVSSTPPGARVTVDGKARGVTPLDLRDVRPGRHEVTLASNAGSVTRTVAVSANATATIDESIFSGFAAVYAPFDVIITEQGRPLTADDRHQIMLPPGPHDLRFENRTLVYETVKQVTIEPGQVTVIQLKPDPSPLSVTASEPAEVWLDGARLGETPLNAAPIPLGIHDIVVKRAAGGERRYTVTVGARPVVLKVDF